MQEIARQIFLGLLVELIIIVIAVVSKGKRNVTLAILVFGTIAAAIVAFPQFRIQLESLLQGNATLDVASTKGWQNTGIHVTSGDKLEIVVISGEWTDQAGYALYTDGDGELNYICGKLQSPSACHEPLPSSPTGSLIGQIGDTAFEIGRGKTIYAKDDGNLRLKINDADDGLYDNEGSLLVRITK